MIPLREIVDRLEAQDGAAGLAVIDRPGAEPEAVWIPRSAAEEPAYLAYSITKTFTAALVLLMRDEGRLALEDRLARWFPHIEGSDRITLRHLLNHTAGIPDYGHLRAYHDAVRVSPSTPWSFERFAAETFDKGLSFEPSSGWAYSNPGYMLLTRIVEAVAEASYADLVARRIARPLGLSRTFVPTSIGDLSPLAPAPSRDVAADGRPRDVRTCYHPGWVSHGVVASTPSDIARFVDALFGGRLIAPSSVAEMTTVVPIPADRADRSRWAEPSYGLGIMADPASRWGRVWGHGGSGPGYRSSAVHAPDLGGVSVCAMCVEAEGRDVERLVPSALEALRRE